MRRPKKINFIDIVKFWRKAIFVVFAFVGVAQAQPFVDDGQVNMFPRKSGPDRSAPFNLFNEYPATINWYMAPSARRMVLAGVNGTTLTIDMHRHVSNGIAAWARAAGVAFNEVSRQSDANITFNNQDILDVYSLDGQTLARTTPPLNGSSTITFYRRNWQNQYPHGDFLRQVQDFMPAGSTEEDAINFIAARTSMHEIGHALGFMHPGTHARQDPTGNFNTIVMLENYENATPAIMEPSQYGFEELYIANERRPIDIANLGISTQERAVLGMLNANREARGRLRNIAAILGISHLFLRKNK